ncbi:HypA-like protein, partial [Penicillium chermesinum]
LQAAALFVSSTIICASTRLLFITSHSNSLRALSASMASVTKIVLDHTKDVGVFSVGISESSARAASEVLQDDLETHHIFFNDSGFHDHIVHHILTIYALGGSPDDIRAAYNNNKTYQLPAMATNSLLVQDLSDNATFMAHLGEKDQYSNYLSFFQNEIKAKGVERTIQEHIFAGTELANNMLGRLYGGLIHPLIHLGFALEFNQPAIVAQALAETAVHEDELGRMFFWPADEKAKKNTKTSYRPFLQLVNEVKEDSVIRSAVKKTDERKILALLTRAPERVLDLVAGYVVPEDKLEEATADMTNAVSYFTGAAQRPKKAVKLDFFLLHSVTCSLFFSKFISLPWLDRATKARMLEWKGRFDLLSYASRGSPDLLLDEVSAYPVTNDWRAVFFSKL